MLALSLIISYQCHVSTLQSESSYPSLCVTVEKRKCGLLLERWAMYVEALPTKTSIFRLKKWKSYVVKCVSCDWWSLSVRFALVPYQKRQPAAIAALHYWVILIIFEPHLLRHPILERLPLHIGRRLALITFWSEYDLNSSVERFCHSSFCDVSN